MKVFIGLCALGILVCLASLGKMVYDYNVPMFAAGDCIRGTDDAEQWEGNFVHKIDVVGKKKYKTRTIFVLEDGTSANGYIIDGDLDFFIQSHYAKVPCPSELSQ